MLTLFKNARILTMKSSDIISGELVVKDNKIAYIGPRYEGEVPDRVIDCEGNLLMPGLKNAHAHTAMVFARSCSDDQELRDWLFETIFPMEAKFEEGDIYHLTKLGILEYLTSGITAAFDMYFHVPEIVKASEEMGFRSIILATSDSEPISLIRERYLTINKPESICKYFLGIHAEYTTSEQRIKDVVGLAHELKAPIYTHICETENEVAGCVERHGMTPVKYLDSLGFYDYGGGGFHCVCFSDEEVEIFKKHNCFVITCPCSNLKLASGIAPLHKYQKAGLTIAIGTDGAGSNNALDMFREMYLTSTLQKVSNKDPKVMDGYEVLRMATVNGAHALGLNESDVLEEGKYADIIMIDLKNPAMQPINNIAKNIVYSGSKDCVKMTMINGKILYYNHEFFVDQDINEIINKANEVTRRLKSWNWINYY